MPVVHLKSEYAAKSYCPNGEKYFDKQHLEVGLMLEWLGHGWLMNGERGLGHSEKLVLVMGGRMRGRGPVPR